MQITITTVFHTNDAAPSRFFAQLAVLDGYLLAETRPSPPALRLVAAVYGPVNRGELKLLHALSACHVDLLELTPPKHHHPYAFAMNRALDAVRREDTVVLVAPADCQPWDVVQRVAMIDRRGSRWDVHTGDRCLVAGIDAAQHMWVPDEQPSLAGLAGIAEAVGARVTRW
jgi:hypothetical protein